MVWEPEGGPGLKGCRQGKLDRTCHWFSKKRVRNREELRALSEPISETKVRGQAKGWDKSSCEPNLE